MRYLIPAAIIIAFLTGCVSQNNLPTNKKPQGWTFSPRPGTAAKVRVIPIRRVAPKYPRRALRRGLQGCVNVSFRIDAHGRPNRLQAIASAPNGIFDQAAIRTMAGWRFRVTDMDGNPVNAESIPMGQVIAFSIGGYGQQSRRLQESHSVVQWICHQPPPKTLVVTSITQRNQIHLSKIKPKEWVNVVQVPDPHQEPVKNGWVDVKFCVNAKSRVSNAAVTKASPEGLYDAAALAALKTWKFTARTMDRAAGIAWMSPRQEPVSTCGLHYRIPVIGQAALSKGPVAINQRPTAIQSHDLALPKTLTAQHGFVTLRFCIDKDGTVRHTKIIKSKPAGVFNQAAQRILQVWSYWPRTVDGKPVRTCNVEESVVFKLGRDKLVWAYPGTS